MNRENEREKHIKNCKSCQKFFDKEYTKSINSEESRKLFPEWFKNNI